MGFGYEVGHVGSHERKAEYYDVHGGVLKVEKNKIRKESIDGDTIAAIAV